MGHRICIVTTGNLMPNPRVVKEADALSGAGFDVRVVYANGSIERQRRSDAAVLASKRWRASAVGWSKYIPSERLTYWRAAVRYQLLRRFPEALWRVWRVAECAEGRLYPELAMLAASEPADLYIGHYPIGLAAAAFAAKRWRTQVGYDAEDLHTGELPDTEMGRRWIRRIDRIERTYIVNCSYVSAVSPGVACALADRYGIPIPTVIYNAFPWSERQATDGLVKDRRGQGMSIYWYSQTIGLDRGIQDVIRAVGLLAGPVQLHLRGSCSPGVHAALLNLAQSSGVAASLFFHPQVSPNELLSRAAEHDVGLATEQPVSRSRMLTVTNKILFALLAGLAVAATDTPGQRLVINSCPQAGFLYPPGNIEDLARKLEIWRTNQQALARAKASALQAAQEVWNWERESQNLVNKVREVMGGS